ncbi:TPA: helix-turn-helix domain-containing protein, partial [Enterococcus faecium]
MNLNKTSVGNRIRLVRKELGLSMKEFGKKITPTAADSIVSRWERGISLPNNDRLTQIAKIAHKDINWLLWGTFKEFISSLLDKEGYTNFLNDFPETVDTIYNDLMPISENLQFPDYENSILRLFNKIYLPIFNDYCLDIIELDLEDFINKRHSISSDKFKNRFLSSFHEGVSNSGYKYGDTDLIYK